MSLIIKGMEMPQAEDIIICGQIDGKLQCTIVTRDKPTKWCEASEVFTPHGRLIDADDLDSIFVVTYPNTGDPFVAGKLKKIIAPPIIEAEVN